MFGHVTANVQTLSKQGLREYKQYYCGLCRALSKRYGALARFMLSFDTTFLFIVLSAAADGTECTLARCPYHLGQKRRCVKGDVADYAADVTVILAYLNIKDDVEDEKTLRSRLLERLFRGAYNKARAARPELCEKVLAELKKLSDAEKRDEHNADIPAACFGRLLGEVFAYSQNAYEFGYALGRFIYLCDAVCDFKSDLKHGRYNPLTGGRMSGFEGILAGELNACCKEYEKLGAKRSQDIIENVLYDGIWLKCRSKGIIK